MMPTPRAFIDFEELDWRHDYDYDTIHHHSRHPAIHIETYDGRMFYFGIVHREKFYGYNDSGYKVTIPINRVRDYAVASNRGLGVFSIANS
jgi:hypothetical protein